MWHPATELSHVEEYFIILGKSVSYLTRALLSTQEKYKSPTDVGLMNTNAAMILQHSSYRKQLEKALVLRQWDLDKEPDNQQYKKAKDDLKDKIVSYNSGEWFEADTKRSARMLDNSRLAFG